MPASLRIGRALPGADALLSGHTFPSRSGVGAALGAEVAFLNVGRDDLSGASGKMSVRVVSENNASRMAEAQGQERHARAQRMPASLRIGRALPGADALLSRHHIPARSGFGVALRGEAAFLKAGRGSLSGVFVKRCFCIAW